MKVETIASRVLRAAELKEKSFSFCGLLNQTRRIESFNCAIGALEKRCMCAGRLFDRRLRIPFCRMIDYIQSLKRCLARSEANVCASTLEVLSKASLRGSAPPNDVFNFVSYVRLTVYITNLLFQVLFCWHSSTNRVYHTVFLKTIVLRVFVMAFMPYKWEQRRCPPCTVTVGVVRRCKMYLPGPIVHCLYRRENFLNRPRRAAHACFPCLLHAWGEHFFLRTHTRWVLTSPITVMKTVSALCWNLVISVSELFQFFPDAFWKKYELVLASLTLWL